MCLRWENAGDDDGDPDGGVDDDDVDDDGGDHVVCDNNGNSGYDIINVVLFPCSKSYISNITRVLKW